jgi:hypothetical protein
MNEYQERFKNFDIRKLLKIIEDAENYQSIAVEAAKLELSNRNVSDEEVQSIKDEFKDRQTKVDKRKRQIRKAENKAKAISTELLKTVSPIQKEPQTIDRKINLIVIVFGLLATYQIFKEFGMIQFMFTNSFAEWDFSMVLYFLPMIILPIAVFLFWKRNKIGWILMGAFFVYNIVNAIRMFFLNWEWNKEDEYTNDYSSGDLQIEFQKIESLFPQPNPIVYLIIVAIFGAPLWVIFKEDLRNEFEINVKSGLLTIGISALITITIMGLI